MKTLFVLALLIGAGLPVVARADALDEAKAAFAAGKAAFERGDWDTALAQFQRADQLSPAPSLAYNIGKTYEKMGRFKDAAVAYEKYLDQVGAPQNDDDKKFQDELRQKIAQDKNTADARRGATPPPANVAPTPPPPPRPAAPPPGYAPPPNYYQPPPPTYANPYGYQYNPYAAPQLTREQRLDNARRKRNSGISSFVAGAVLAGLGAGLVGGGCAVSAGCNDFNNGNVVAAASMLAIGVPCLIVGPILIGVGAANWGKYQGEMNKIEKETPRAQLPLEPTAAAPGQPTAWLFGLPPVRF